MSGAILDADSKYPTNLGGNVGYWHGEVVGRVGRTPRGARRSACDRAGPARRRLGVALQPQFLSPTLVPTQFGGQAKDSEYFPQGGWTVTSAVPLGLKAGLSRPPGADQPGCAPGRWPP